MDTKPIEIKLDLSKVASNSMIHIQNINDCVTQVFNALSQINDLIDKPLPTDSLPIRIDTKRPRLNFHDQKLKTIDWVLQKGFEDIIYGLLKSFKEAYRFLRTYSLSIEYHKNNKATSIENDLKRIESEIEDLPFPAFIDEFQKLLQKEIPLKEQIKSINRVRICLVHRHGIVGEKDLKYASNNSLILKWINFKYWAKNEKNEIEITYDIRKEGILAKEISLQAIEQEKSFNLGDEIKIDINEFNGIALTCVLFVQQLYGIMPIPKK